MSDTQMLLGKVSALRRQLEQIQATGSAAESAYPSPDGEQDEPGRLRRLERKVMAGAQQTIMLDSALRQLEPHSLQSDSPVLPRQLTSRARRIVERGRILLDQLRTLSDQFESGAGEPEKFTSVESDPLAERYHETVAMADTSLRIVQSLPDSPSAQLRLCAGLEAILGVIGERIEGLRTALHLRRREELQIETLSDLLAWLQAGKFADIQKFVMIGEALLDDARQSAPLRFFYGSPENPARFVACHSLTTAQVMARLVTHVPEMRSDPLEPVLAALLHDAGMLSVPAPILKKPGPLDDAQRRIVEGHTRAGAEIMTRLLPAGVWLAEAAANHHERFDGTGYPNGLRELQVAPLTHLLAVCDIYAAMCAPRPYRRAFDTRTALTDTLLLAEDGKLDRFHAEKLLQLSFYPIGSIVELTDGSVGMVVATHMNRHELNIPSRPVIAILTNTDGQPLPTPRHADLAECEGISIVRNLPQPDRRELLGKRYPELV